MDLTKNGLLTGMLAAIGIVKGLFPGVMGASGFESTLFLFAVSMMLAEVFVMVYHRLGRWGRAYYLILTISTSSSFAGLLALSSINPLIWMGEMAIVPVMTIYASILVFCFVVLNAHIRPPRFDCLWPRGAGIKAI